MVEPYDDEVEEQLLSVSTLVSLCFYQQLIFDLLHYCAYRT